MAAVTIILLPISKHTSFFFSFLNLIRTMKSLVQTFDSTPKPLNKENSTDNCYYSQSNQMRLSAIQTGLYLFVLFATTLHITTMGEETKSQWHLSYIFKRRNWDGKFLNCCNNFFGFQSLLAIQHRLSSKKDNWHNAPFLPPTQLYPLYHTANRVRLPFLLSCAS